LIGCMKVRGKRIAYSPDPALRASIQTSRHC
jgi:hypothetical protein